MKYLLIVDLYHSISVGVQLLKTLCQRSKHDTALDKVVKFHRTLIVTIKNLRADITKTHGAAGNMKRNGDLQFSLHAVGIDTTLNTKHGIKT